MQFRERKRSWLSWDISGMEGRVGNSWEYIYNNSCDHHSLVPGGVQVSKVMRTKQIALTGKSSQSPGSWQWQVLAYKVHELRHYVYLHNIFMSKWVEDQIWWFQSSWVPRYDYIMASLVLSTRWMLLKVKQVNNLASLNYKFKISLRISKYLMIFFKN